MSTQLDEAGPPPAAPPRGRGDHRTRIEPWQDPGAEPFIRIQNVTKQYGDVYAVDNVSLDIYQREFWAPRAAARPRSCGCSPASRRRPLVGS